MLVYEYNPNPVENQRIIISNVDISCEGLISAKFFNSPKDNTNAGGTLVNTNTEDDVSKWCRFTYSVPCVNFKDSGFCEVQVSSKMVKTQTAVKLGATTENTDINNSLTKGAKLAFWVDNEIPDIFLTNLKSGDQYNTESYNVAMTVRDNFVVSLIVVAGQDGS